MSDRVAELAPRSGQERLDFRIGSGLPGGDRGTIRHRHMPERLVTGAIAADHRLEAGEQGDQPVARGGMPAVGGAQVLQCELCRVVRGLSAIAAHELGEPLDRGDVLGLQDVAVIDLVRQLLPVPARLAGDVPLGIVGVESEELGRRMLPPL